MASIFSKIIAGEIPCYKVQENERFLAFLDIQPLRRGHVLVIPKVEIDNIFDIEDELLGEMMIFSKSVAKRIQQNFECKKVGVTVIGLEVPHAHIHLIPISSPNDLNFTQHKPQASPDSLKKVQEKIIAHL